MRVGSFSVQIPQGQERESGHVQLLHKAVYSIRISSHHNRRSDATVTVDGKEVGTFRLDPQRSITLERPAHDTGCFTFFAAASTEAAQAGVVGIASPDRGLIQVKFQVEKLRERVVGRSATVPDSAGYSSDYITEYAKSIPQNTTYRSCVGSQSVSAGITGLTGQSSQQFVNVAEMEYDPAEETLISLRLVAVQEVRQLTAIPKSNNIPAAI